MAVGRDRNHVTLVLILTLVSAVSLRLEPGVNNRRRFGSEPRLLKPYSILFAIRQTNKFMRLPEWSTQGNQWWSMCCMACLHQHWRPLREEPSQSGKSLSLSWYSKFRICPTWNCQVQPAMAMDGPRSNYNTPHCINPNNGRGGMYFKLVAT